MKSFSSKRNELHKDKEKSLDKEFEKLEVLGEGTVSDARKVLEEDKKESEVKRNVVLEAIDEAVKKTIKRDTYHTFIASLLVKRIREVVDLDNFKFEVRPNDKGIVLELYEGKRVWRIGFTPTGIAKYDLNAIEVYTMRVENTIYQNERRNQTPSNTQGLIRE